jgi:glycosyltransferase involved in cell wall biosynthesis
MKILALTSIFPNPFRPHYAPYNRQLFLAMNRQAELRVISPISWIEELTAWRRGDGLLRDRRHAIEGVIVDHPRYLYTPRVMRRWYGRFYCFSVRKAFERALAEFRPDIVFAPWAYPDGWAAGRLGHQAGLPVVTKVHGSDVRVLSRIRGRRRKTAEALRGADGVVTVSQELARQVIDLGVDQNRVRAIMSGIDSHLFTPGPREQARGRLGLPSKGIVLLFVGNLVPVKGLDVLLDACSSLARSGMEFTCYLIGPGPLRAELDSQVARLDLGQHVHLLGNQPNGLLPDWFRAANLFVLPSRSEGLPTVLLECLACGTPFVASRVGGIPELANLGPCRLVRPEDSQQLANAIRMMIVESERNASTGQSVARPRLPTHDDEATEVLAFLKSVREDYLRRTVPAVSASCVPSLAE